MSEKIKLISERTWKLFIPILMVIIIMFLAYYSRDLLKYGNREAYPIFEIVEGVLWAIMGLSVVLILFIIEIFLTNYLQKMRIDDLEKNLKELKKKEK